MGDLMLRRLGGLVPAIAIAAVFGAATQAAALECGEQAYRGATYAVCKVDLARDDLRIWHRRPDGAPFYSLGAVADAVAPRGRLAFAMNAGMYHPDRDPVGLLVIDGKRTGRLITADGPGNFGLLPNGVFCWGGGRGAVIESRRFARRKPDCRFATQSGPMLVIGGRLHPRFLPGGSSRHVRNGVGVARDRRTAYFAITREPVNLYDFARFFRDRLKTPNALYLDGNVSRMYAPAIGWRNRGGLFGPILGVVEAGAE